MATVISQGYPLWVVHGHGGGKVEAEAVVAWGIGDLEAPHAWPITATCGLLGADDIGSFIDTEAEVLKFRENIQRARRGNQGGAQF